MKKINEFKNKTFEGRDIKNEDIIKQKKNLDKSEITKVIIYFL